MRDKYLFLQSFLVGRPRFERGTNGLKVRLVFLLNSLFLFTFLPFLLSNCLVQILHKTARKLLIYSSKLDRFATCSSPGIRSNNH
jgi:hypothetical protein